MEHDNRFKYTQSRHHIVNENKRPCHPFGPARVPLLPRATGGQPLLVYAHFLSESLEMDQRCPVPRPAKLASLESVLSTATLSRILVPADIPQQDRMSSSIFYGILGLNLRADRVHQVVVSLVTEHGIAWSNLIHPYCFPDNWSSSIGHDSIRVSRGLACLKVKLNSYRRCAYLFSFPFEIHVITNPVEGLMQNPVVTNRVLSLNNVQNIGNFFSAA